MSQPPNPWGNQQPQQPPQQPQQPTQQYPYPYNQQQPPQQYPQQYQNYSQQPQYPPQQNPQGLWNPSGVYGGVLEPKKKIPWWVWVVVGFVVLFIIGTIANLSKTKDATQVPVAQATNSPASEITPTAGQAVVVSNVVKPTATDRPVPNPKPTATPLPPTITPNIPGTQAAVANITELAKQKDQANAQATADALPKILTFTGSGKKVITGVQLNAGVARFTMSHTGTSNFAVEFLDQNGNPKGLPANAIGNYSGSTFVPVDAKGTYALGITADGNWKIVITDMEILKQEGSIKGPLYKGHGPAALKIQMAKSGLAVFNMTHNGQSNFAVVAYDANNGSVLDLLANEIGPFSGQKAFSADAGALFLDIAADGDWTIEVTS